MACRIVIHSVKESKSTGIIRRLRRYRALDWIIPHGQSHKIITINRRYLLSVGGKVRP
jgi:hypothetical protein